MKSRAMTLLRWLLAATLLSGGSIPVLASPLSPAGDTADLSIRILESHHPSRLRLVPETAGWLRAGTAPRLAWRAGEPLVVVATRQGLRVQGPGGSPHVVGVVTASSVAMRTTLPGGGTRRYRGRVTMRCPPGSSGEIHLVLGTDLEGYVASVVAAEMPVSSPPQALEAQAVSVRSFTASLARLDRRRGGDSRPVPRGPHAGDGWDFCDLTHCQAFRGLPDPDSPSWVAARATRNQVLLQGGRVVVACYHSTCGGHTANASDVLPQLSLRGVADGPPSRPWCARSPHARWRVVVPGSELRAALASDDSTSPGAVLHDLRVIERTPHGRVLRLEIRGEHTQRVGATDLFLVLGRTLGWGRIESTWFTVRRQSESFVFEGRGLGHGLGLCQYGCMEMARQGRTTSRILAHYFPGSRLADLEGAP